jgi:hypothetical protein
MIHPLHERKICSPIVARNILGGEFWRFANDKIACASRKELDEVKACHITQMG